MGKGIDVGTLTLYPYPGVWVFWWVYPRVPLVKKKVFDKTLSILPNSYRYCNFSQGYPPVPRGIPTKGMGKGTDFCTLTNTHTLGEGMGILEGMGKGIGSDTPGYTHATPYP